jgi:enoyl-CoA hydratase/carnithine racemase
MSYEDIVVTREASWIEIALNRPKKLNALREQTAEEILCVLSDLEQDRNIKAVILGGSEKAFCTGVDTSEFQLKKEGYFDFFRYRKRSFKVNRLFREMVTFTKPVITAIEGFALGGGLELALLGDIIIAGKDAKFGLPEVRLGMMPGGGGTQTLARLIGKPLAKELMWTGRRLSASEALQCRLANHVTEPGEALAKARSIASAIAENAPISVMLTKSLIDRGVDMALPHGIESEGDASFLLYFSEDRSEGLQAFHEKRPPIFRGE